MNREIFNHTFEIERDSPSGLVWKNPPTKQFAVGSVAGGRDERGYWRVRCKKSRFKVHRVIALMSGIITEEEFNTPSVVVDHRDGNPSNNKLDNLRKATQRLNCNNRSCHRDGRLVGATFERRTGRWFSRITTDRGTLHLGTFDTEEEAHNAYKAAYESLEQT